MRKILLASILAFTTASASHAATVIGFEDLQARRSFSSWGITGSYQGYVWGYGNAGGVAARTFNNASTGWASATISNPASGAPGNVTGTAYAWTWGGPQSLWIDFQEATDVNSVDLSTLSASYGLNSSSVQLFGYDEADNLIASTSVFALTDNLQTFAANLVGVHYLEIRSDRNRSWFSIDNLTLSANVGAVPEPATWAFMIFGFGAVGAAMRRQRKAKVSVSYA